MDRKTLAAYDCDAAAFAKDWHDQPAPVDLQEIVERFFVRGGNSADIGCGSGREVAWLNANGFSAVGFDASDGLLAEARSRYPGLKFAHAELPDLKGIGARRLRQRAVRNRDHASRPRADRGRGPPPARHRQAQRHSLSELARHRRAPTCATPKGRLYAAFDAALVRAELKTATLLLDEEVVSASSGKKIHRLVAKKPGLEIRE